MNSIVTLLLINELQLNFEVKNTIAAALRTVLIYRGNKVELLVSVSLYGTVSK